MLKIEFKSKKAKDVKRYIIVNGHLDRMATIIGDNNISAYFYEPSVINILLNQSFEDIGDYFSSVQINYKVEWNDNDLGIVIICNKYFNYKFPSIIINLEINFEEWAKPWSISDFASEFKSTIKSLRNTKFKYFQQHEFVTSGFGIQAVYSDKKIIIKNKLDEVLKTLKKVLETTNKNLLSKIDKNALITFFEFPNEIKAACKQYLIYFTQFLLDVGIEAETEIKEEAQKTLFKIIPKDQNQSLEQIREALQIYLKTPSLNNSEESPPNNSDIAILQWQANIMHLKSQLLLVNSILQAKEATIENLQLSNFQYQELLKEKKLTNNKDEEPLIKNILSVQKIEGKGFSINLPEIFRRLKRKLK